MTMPLLEICIDCNAEFRPIKNSVCIVQTIDGHIPYRIWYGDLMECPHCGTQIIAGIAQSHMYEHLIDDLNAIIKHEIEIDNDVIYVHDNYTEQREAYLSK